MFPGQWEIAEVAPNSDATAFWRSVIAKYTDGNFEERIEDGDKWQGPVQTFDTRQHIAAGGTA